VPPFLVGLAGATGSLTYSNISDLFDFHDRSGLRPSARTVMEALGAWALPRGQDLEVNSDDYTRLPLDKRALAYKTMVEIGVLSAEEIRAMERYNGGPWTSALTGAQITPDAPAPPAAPKPVPVSSTTASPSTNGARPSGQRHPGAGSGRRPGIGGAGTP
jgi:hypothetical protein